MFTECTFDTKRSRHSCHRDFVILIAHTCSALFLARDAARRSERTRRRIIRVQSFASSTRILGFAWHDWRRLPRRLFSRFSTWRSARDEMSQGRVLGRISGPRDRLLSRSCARMRATRCLKDHASRGGPSSLLASEGSGTAGQHCADGRLYDAAALHSLAADEG